MTTFGSSPLRPWIAALASVAAGAISVLGFAPTFLWPVNAAALIVLVVLFDDAARTQNPRRAGFWRGWLFGFGAFLAGLNWIANAFLVDLEKFGALALPAVLALPATLALFWAFAGLMSLCLWTKDWRRLLVFVGSILVFESLRATILTGFPWNLPGHVWNAGGSVSQMASVVGLNGLSGLTVAIFAAPAIWFGSDNRRIKITASTGAALVLLSMAGFGLYRLSSAATSPLSNAPIIAVVDAGFTQKEKWLPENRDAIARRYVELLDDPAATRADVVVWPEGATPFPLLEDARTLKGIDERLGSRTLATGLVRRDLMGPGREEIYNSVATIVRDDKGMALRSLYDKNHLVPFGEYVPFGAVFDAFGLRSLVSYGSDFTPGPPPKPILIPGAPMAWPLICYEAIFPIVVSTGVTRPGWLLNVSVDAWFGGGQGPAQHFNQARYRSIESGLPMARAASGGPSGIIDPYGRVVVLLDKKGGVTSAPLPPALKRPLYSGNDYFSWGLITLIFLLRGITGRFHSK